VIEGVFGWLAREALPRATRLVWLTIPEAECARNLAARPAKAGEDAASRADLVQWCLDYAIRQNANSRAGHLALFTDFPGAKVCLATRDAMAAFLARPA